MCGFERMCFLERVWFFEHVCFLERVCVFEDVCFLVCLCGGRRGYMLCLIYTYMMYLPKVGLFNSGIGCQFIYSGVYSGVCSGAGAGVG